MARCVTHDSYVPNDKACTRCTTCKHPSVYKFKGDVEYSCNGCYRKFPVKPDGAKDVQVCIGREWISEEEYENRLALQEPLSVASEEQVSVANELSVAENPLSVACTVCHKQFIPIRTSAKFCSTTCRSKAHREEK